MATNPAPEPTKRKAIVYIDGFNLYFALKEKGWLGFMWLDLLKFSHGLIGKDQELIEVKYFTSRIKNNPEKQKRQSLYLDALGTLDGAKLKIFYGDYQDNQMTCRNCNRSIPDPQEKQTDVNIATHMILDAFSRDKVDDLILVTADSDQCPAVRAVRVLKKRVVVMLPPGRGEYMELKKTADAHLEITAKKFKNARLDDRIVVSPEFIIECPRKWRND